MFLRLTGLLLLLPASGLSQGVVHVVGGTPADVGFGSSMDGGADVDGDGYADLIVGAWKGCVGISASVVSGRTGVVKLRIAAPATATDAQFARDVCLVDDVNLDGFADFAVGAPHTDQTPFGKEGAIYVYSGSDGSLLATFYGASTGAFIGEVLARAGDVNADGRGDVYSWYRKPTGAIEVQGYSPATGTGAGGISTGTGASVGFALENIGDTNNDGQSEVAAIGSTSTALYFVKKPGTTQVAIDFPFTIGGFLHGVAGGHDFNGDGTVDYAFGFSAASAGPSSLAGKVVVFDGVTGNTINWMPGSFPKEMLGRSLVMLPDSDGDSKAELVVGTGPRLTSSSCGQNDTSVQFSWRVLAHGPGPTFTTIAHVDAAPGTSEGFEIASVGDVNGDGYPEFAVSSPTEGKGIVRIYVRVRPPTP